MRTNQIIFAVAVIGSVGACKWTEFDDLADEAWVGSIEPPNGDSTDYAVALQRGQLNANLGEGGSLVVLGAGQAQYTQLLFSATGVASVPATALKLNSQFGVGNLETPPLLLADPSTDDVALVVNTGSNQVSVLHGVGDLIPRQIFGLETPVAATFMIAPARADGVGGTAPQRPYPIVAGGLMADTVFGRPYENYTQTPTPQCQLLDQPSASGGLAVTIRAVGAAFVSSMTTHDLVVWTAAGDLRIYDGRVFNGQPPAGDLTICPMGTMGGVASPLVGSMHVSTAFMPGRGSQILVYKDRYAILIGRKDLPIPDSFIAMYDMRPTVAPPYMPVQLGTPITVPDLRTAAILEVGTQAYLVAGYPTATFDGVKAGRVQVYAFNTTTTGINPEAEMTLHDAEPESEQQFGRSIAITEFNGAPVIAVAADNEVFFYFRTALYGETREGR